MAEGEFWITTPKLFFKMLHLRRLARYREAYPMALLTAKLSNMFPNDRGIRGYTPHDFMVDVPPSIKKAFRDANRARVAGLAQATLASAHKKHESIKEGTHGATGS